MLACWLAKHNITRTDVRTYILTPCLVLMSEPKITTCICFQFQHLINEYNIFSYLQNNVRTKKKVTRMAIKTAMQFTIGILMMVTLAATWRTKLLLSQDSTKLLNIQHHCTLFPVLVLFTNFGFLLIIYLNAVYCNC